MPTIADPSEWLAELLETAWDTGVEDLRAQGHDITVARPIIKAASDSQSGGNAHELRCKIFQVGDELNATVSQGELDQDAESEWAIDIQMKSRGGSRRSVHQAGEVVKRVLQLYRRNPHPEWHELHGIRLAHQEDYFDYQHRVVRFTLRRYGEVLPSPVEVSL
jgi:hypothetical protein